MTSLRRRTARRRAPGGVRGGSATGSVVASGAGAETGAGMGSVGILSDHYPSLDADLVIPSLSALPLDAFDELLGE